MLDLPELDDWWTAVGSAAPDDRRCTRSGPGSALLVRAATRLLRIGD